MPELLFGSGRGMATPRCVRAAGTITWQRQEGARGRFFPLHDLTHHAVETVVARRAPLCWRSSRRWRGQYGLLLREGVWASVSLVGLRRVWLAPEGARLAW